jgi:hypothetical protein
MKRTSLIPGPLQFTLTSDQVSSGKLVPSTSAPSLVTYSILDNPSTYSNQFGFSTVNYTDSVYNSEQAEADLFWSTGYFTLQNFIATYLAKEYNTMVPSDYTVSCPIL